MNRPDLAIVVLNWNGRKLLEEYIPPLVAHTPPDVADLVVIDNGSTDDSLAYLQEAFPQVKLVRLSENYGFAGGYNRGLRQLDYPYYCLLNSDVRVSPHWCDRPLALLREGLAAVQPKLHSDRQPEAFEYAGAAGGELDRWGYPFCRGRLFDTVELDHGQYDEECEILWATGACYFVSSEAFWQVGGFDESFFAHMEEIDLSWRLWLAGGRLRYTPDSVVYHLGGATLEMGSPRKSYLNFRNNLRMLYKNLPTRHARRRILICRLPLDLLAALTFLVKGQPRHATAVLRAVRDFYRTRRQLARSADQPWYQPTAIPPIARYSLLWQYHLRRRRTYDQLPS